MKIVFVDRAMFVSKCILKSFSKQNL